MQDNTESAGCLHWAEAAMAASGLCPWEWERDGDRLTILGDWSAVLDPAIHGRPASLQDWAGLLHPDDAVTLRSRLDVRAAPGGEIRLRVRLRSSDGGWSWVLWQCRVEAVDADGLPRRLVGTVMDIGMTRMTEDLLREKQAHVERLELELAQTTARLEDRVRARTSDLRENARFLEAVLRGIGAGIVVVREDSGEIVEMNGRAEQILGFPPYHFLGRLCSDLPELILPHDRRRMPLCDGACRGAGQEDGVIRRQDGSPLFVSRTLVTVEREGRLHLVALLLDQSARKALESQLAMAQKLESVGRLASGVAHEINTPIQYVGDNLRFLQDSWRDVLRMLGVCGPLFAGTDTDVAAVRTVAAEIDIDFLIDEIPRALDQAIEGTERVTAIVRAMKRFAHPGGDAMSLVDLNKALETTALVARNEWKYLADLELALDPDLPTVPCLANDMNQVFLNIIINAGHAIAERQEAEGNADMGRIVVRTRLEADQAVVSISDTGCGIPEENRERIFDQFFTTKEVGKGTGQGLAIVHDVVVGKHGGRIEVKSEVGRGTTFTLHIPLNQQDSAFSDVEDWR
jgi:two-component system NtrC family sensor kinase